jgi:hypothetical protein
MGTTPSSACSRSQDKADAPSSISVGRQCSGRWQCREDHDTWIVFSINLLQIVFFFILVLFFKARIHEKCKKNYDKTNFKTRLISYSKP